MPRFIEGTGVINPPTTTTAAERTRIKNRRKRYLDLHPEYFGPQLELADPLLYDRLIRRFQTAAEREAEGRKKGYSGILEADLYRSEAKLDALRHPDPNGIFTYKRGPNGEILEEEKDEVPADKEDGMARWRWEMENRFLRGADDDFDYDGVVDGNSEYDDHVVEERDAEDRYFDGEEPAFVVRTRSRTTTSADDEQEGEESQKIGKKELQGETGVQDF